MENAPRPFSLIPLSIDRLRHIILFIMADQAPKLTTTQGDALVYTTLVGFGLVGVYAGWRVKSNLDFLSAFRTQAAFPLALNWIASS